MEASSWHAQKTLEIAKLVINQSSYGYIGTGQIQFSLKKNSDSPKTLAVVLGGDKQHCM